ncbi:S-formylglutathione hydrolase [Saccharibacter sp. 17.LH.SD]|nr:S-formylglutathione hydrolase [Saccharibacter sp. 17.LH.SD]MXV44496.1 S-formylglutathione hydrolase [Saccharibacter sp. 17.LH.SD]
MDSKSITVMERHACCGGEVRFLSHPSRELGLEAKLGVFLPRQALEGELVPVLYVLAGMTSTYENFLIKANAVRYAAEHGIALVTPDTSPRGANVAGEDDAVDLGTGAGYYVDATSDPWRKHYRMASYVERELPELMESLFPFDADRCGIAGHSMGGIGALSLALRHPEKWKTVSAFAPISAPSQVEWGKKVTAAYFGGDKSQWNSYDPTLLLKSGHRHVGPILVDQGLNDDLIKELRPDLLEEAAKQAGQTLTLRHHKGYDHGYWFVQTFVADHIRHHAEGLLPR